jgi:hypothetical protein
VLHQFNGTTFNSGLSLGSTEMNRSALAVNAAGAKIVYMQDETVQLLITNTLVTTLGTTSTIDSYDVDDRGIGISSLGDSVFIYWESRYNLGGKVYVVP